MQLLNNAKYIIYNDEDNTFTINSNNSTYQMKIDENKSLLHTWYGEKTVGSDYSYIFTHLDVGFSGNPGDRSTDKTYSFDTLPQEFPQYGTGDFRINALEVLWANGTRGTDFRYESHELYSGKYELEGQPHFWSREDSDAETLVIRLKDRFSDLKLELYYSVFPEYDLITRSAKLINETSETVYIKNFASAALDFVYSDYDILHLPGQHTGERNAEVTELGKNIFQLRSTRGTSSHQHNPSIILQGKDTTETVGEAYGVSLIYSGGFNISCEKDQLGQTRMVAGLDNSNFNWKLEVGDCFETPELALSYSKNGRGKLSRNLHNAVNNNLIKSAWVNKRRPVLVNNWEATYFDFTKDKILEIVRKAKELNFDLFVLDDGWFGKRDLDISGLGDWIPNEAKLGGTLADLVKEVNEIGLDFGIWMEPEMVNEDSDLYREHPEWALAILGKSPVRARTQLVLDFSREDVQDFAINALDNVLQAGNISYLKWDMNRSLFDLYSEVLPADRQGEVSHRHVLGVYRVFQHLLDNYPDLLVEGCSGGGGRFDLGMLYYTPQIWTSDNTDAIDRTRIQHGTSFFYPVSTISAHVSAVPNHQNQRVVPISTRAITALQGAFGYELDLNTLTEAEQKFTKNFIEFYNEHWETVQKGEYYRIIDPYEDKYITVWEMVGKGKDNAILVVVYKDLMTSKLPKLIKWQGLDKNAEYKVTLYNESGIREIGEYKAADLETAGLKIEQASRNYDAVWYVAEKV